MLYKTIVLSIFLLTAFYGYSNENYWIQQGDLSYNNQNIEESIIHYTRAIEERPKEPLAYIKRAQALRAIGSFVKSAEDIKTAIELDPEFTRVYLVSEKKRTSFQKK